MKTSFLGSRVAYLLYGAIITLAITMLLGATEFPAPHYGRYQISSWSVPVGKDLAGVGAFVLDTATGETKLVYNRTIQLTNQAPTSKDELNKPFANIR